MAAAVAGVLAVWSPVLAAQGGPLTVTPFVRPDVSPFLADWERDPQSAFLTVTHTGSGDLDYRVLLTVRQSGRGEVAFVQSPVLAFVGGAGTQLFGLPDLLEWQVVRSVPEITTIALRSGQLPEGRLQVCARPVRPDAATPLGPESCVERDVRLPEPPQLLVPANGARVGGAQPVFQWAPVRAPPGSTLQYRVRIVERQPEQPAIVALQSNRPVLETEVPVRSSVLPYPLDALPLRDDREYAWQVEVVDENGRPVTRAGRSSEAWTFTATETTGPGTPELDDVPDTLSIVPDVVFLHGLRRLARARAASNEFGVGVTGRLLLSVRGDVEFDIPMDARDVVFDRLRMPTARLMRGELRGAIAGRAVVFGKGGIPLQVVDAVMTPDDGVSFGVALTWPGAGPTRFPQRARPGARGLEGALTWEGSIVAGAAPLRVTVRRARVLLPEPAVSIEASAELFGQAATCRVQPADGEDNATSLTCPSVVAVPIAGGARGLALELRGATAQLRFDDAAATTTLSAAARVTFAGAAGCAATGRVAFAKGTLESAFTPLGCGDGGRAPVLRSGTASTTLYGFDVKALTWTGASLEVAASLDAEVSMGGPWAGLAASARSADITVSGRGLEVPAQRIREEGKGEVLVEGWRFVAGALDLPEQVIEWDAWRDAERSPFRWQLRGHLTFADAGGSACVAAAVEVAALTGDALTLPLEAAERRGGRCAVTLAPSAAQLGVTAVSGAPIAVASATGGLSWQTPPDVAGDLEIASPACLDRSPQRYRLAGGVSLRQASGAPWRLTGSLPSARLACGIALPSMRLVRGEGAITFDEADGRQRARFQGKVAVELPGSTPPPVGEGEGDFDLMAGTWLDGAVAIGPATIGVPANDPLMQFDVPGLELRPTVTRIDGRGALRLPDGASVPATFIDLRLDPATQTIRLGRVAFDAPFALEFAIGADGYRWTTEASGSRVRADAGARVTLPAGAVLGIDGLTARGDATGHLRFEGRDLSGLVTRFPDGFAFALSPAGIRAGQVEFYAAAPPTPTPPAGSTGGASGTLPATPTLVPPTVTTAPTVTTPVASGPRLAWLDGSGLHPAWAATSEGLVPSRLGLPSVDVAYLELRDPVTGMLAVTPTPEDGGIRIRSARALPLVVPSLAAGGAAPRIDVPVDLLLDPVTGVPTRGEIVATLPSGDVRFDFSARGAPFVVDVIRATASPRGTAPLLAFEGRPVVLGRAVGAAGATRLEVGSDGRAVGTVAVSAATVIDEVRGARPFRLTLESLRGPLQLQLTRAPTADVSWTGSAAVLLGLGQSSSITIPATVEVQDADVRVTPSDVTQAPIVPGLGYNVVLRQLAFSRLAWNAAMRQMDFELQADAHLQFPQFDGFETPAIRGATLTRGGFRLPAVTMPELVGGLADWNGWGARPMALRLAVARTIPWYDGGSVVDPALRLDVELRPNALAAEAMPWLNGLRLSALDARVDNGWLSGSIESTLMINRRLRLAPQTELRLTRLAGRLGDPTTPEAAQRRGARLETAAEVTRRQALVPRRASQVDVFAQGDFLVSQMRACQQPAPRITIPDGAVRLLGDGALSGTIANVDFGCPLAFGPLSLQLARGTVSIGVPAPGGASNLPLHVATATTVRLPSATGGADQPFTGPLVIDLDAVRILGGSIAVAAPVGVPLPWTQPVFRAVAPAGRLDANGLTFTGTGTVATPGGGTGAAIFTDLQLSGATLAVSAGEVSLATNVRVTATATGAAAPTLTWEANNAPLPTTDRYATFITPNPLRITAAGPQFGSADAPATGALKLGTESWASLTAFPSAEFRLGDGYRTVVAGELRYRDQQLLTAVVLPSEIRDVRFLAAGLAEPDSIPIGRWDQAYLRLKRGAVPRVRYTTTPAGLRIETLSGAGVELVLKGYQLLAPTAPEVIVMGLDVTIDPATNVVVAGGFDMQAVGDGVLVDLLPNLFPVSPSRARLHQPTPNGPFRLDLDLRLRLPGVLGVRPVTATGVPYLASLEARTIESGTMDTRFVDGRVPVLSIPLRETVSDTLVFNLTGFRVTLPAGGTPGVAVVGNVRSSLFGRPASSSAGQSAGDRVARMRPFFFTGSLGAGGLQLSYDPGQDIAEPIGFAGLNFALRSFGSDPGLSLEVTSTVFRLRMNAAASSPILPRFLLSLRGFQVGTEGLTLPQITLEEDQRLPLFGLEFALQDSVVGGQVVFPALGATKNAAGWEVSLAGRVFVFGQAARFVGLTLSPVDGVRLQNLVFTPGVQIVPGVLRLDGMRTDAAGALLLAMHATLPAPFGGSGLAGTMRIAPTTTSLATLLFDLLPAVDPAVPTAPGPRNIIIGDLGIHVRRLALAFGGSSSAIPLNQIALEAIADAYWKQDAAKRLRFGDVVNGVPLNGLRLGLAGEFRVLNVSLPQQFDLDAGPLKVSLKQVIPPDVNDRTRMARFNGELGVNLAVAALKIDAENVGLSDVGIVNMAGATLKEGSFRIPYFLNATVKDAAFSFAPGKLSVARGETMDAEAAKPGKGGGSDPAAKMEIDVDMYMSLTADLSVMDVLSGGVKRLVIYRSASKNAFIIEEASLDAPLKALDINAKVDLRFLDAGPDFEMVVGGRVTLKVASSGFKLEGALVGAFAQQAGVTRAGLFVAVGGGKAVKVPMGAVALTGAGFGFFVNPRASWLTMVQKRSGLGEADAKANEMITRDGGAGFAVIGYAQITDLAGVLMKIDVLLTVSNVGLLLQGKGKLLPVKDPPSPDDEGGPEPEKGVGASIKAGWEDVRAGKVAPEVSVKATLAIRFTPFAATGNFAATIDVAGALTGSAKVSFWAYTDSRKIGVVGKGNLNFIDLVTGEVEVFAGNLGFYGKLAFESELPPVLFLNVERFMFEAYSITLPGEGEGSYPAYEVGAYVNAKGSITALGLIGVGITIEGALILGADPLVYGYGAAQAEVVGEGVGPSVEVWARWAKKAGAAVGFGPGDPVARARIEKMRKTIDLLRQKAKEAKDKVVAPLPPWNAPTGAALAAAFARVSEGNELMMNLEMRAEAEGASGFDATPQETAYWNWYIEKLRSANDRATTTQLATQLSATRNDVAAVTSRAAAVGARLESIRATVAPYAPVTAGRPRPRPIAGTIPTTPPDEGDPDPSLAFDRPASAALREAVTEAQAANQIVDPQLLARLDAMESALLQVRAAMENEADGLMTYASSFREAVLRADTTYAVTRDYFQRRAVFLRALAAEVQGRRAEAEAWIDAKTARLSAPNSQNRWPVLRAVGQNRARVLDRLIAAPRPSGATGYAPVFEDQFLATTNVAGPLPALQQQVRNVGLNLWSDIGIGGAQRLAEAAEARRDTLGMQAAQVVPPVKEALAEVSAAIDELQEVTGEAYGSLYDVYDALLANRSDLPAAVRTVWEGRKAALATAMRVPTISTLAVNSTRAGFLTRTSLEVTATHPAGVIEWRVREDSGGAPARFLSIGAPRPSQPIWPIQRFGIAANTSPTPRTVTFEARGIGGFSARRSVTFTPSLATLDGAALPPAVSVPTRTAAGVDATPPSAPVISFPNRFDFESPTAPEQWVASPERILAAWNAEDPESGIGGFDVELRNVDPALGLWATVPGAPYTIARAFADVGGRRSQAITGLPFGSTPATSGVQLAVRARNGSGLSTTAVSGTIRLDPTPPVVTSPTPLSALSGMRLGPAPAAPPATFTGTVTPSPVCDPSLWQLPVAQPTPTLVPPAGLIRIDGISDPESGLGGVLAYRLGTAPQTTYDSASWTRAPWNVNRQWFSVGGATLDYATDYHFSTVLFNRAGAPTGVQTLGPLRFLDPTPPTAPAVCITPGSGSALNLQISTPARDDETGVSAYEVQIVDSVPPAPPRFMTNRRVRTATIPLSGGAPAFVPIPGIALEDGRSYTVRVRARNGQGQLGPMVASGPLSVDRSPPPAPIITSVQWLPADFCGFPMSAINCLQVDLTTPDDPHSGISRWSWSFSSTRNGPFGFPMTWSMAGGTRTGPATSRVSIPFPQQMDNDWYRLHVTSYNGGNMPSQTTVFFFQR